jgi:hypothetical protein
MERSEYRRYDPASCRHNVMQNGRKFVRYTTECTDSSHCNRQIELKTFHFFSLQLWNSKDGPF